VIDVAASTGAESSAGGPVPRDQIRAGTADRERVVKQLNEAFGEGRLDVAELEERVGAAYAAKTLGELTPLTVDLPNAGAPPIPASGWPPPTWPPPPTPPAAPRPLNRPATVQDLKQAALDLATSKINARLDRDRMRREQRMMREQRRSVHRQQRYDLMRQATGSRYSVAAWASTSALCFVIWLIAVLTGGGLNPWFLWVAGPWGIMLLMRALADRRAS
jgi:Domain of unknown function (DUF1707)